MKSIIRVILLLFISFNCGYSQNLVINPGFEETDTVNIKRTFENYHCLTGWDFNVYNKQSWYLGTGIKNGNFSYASKVNNGLKPKSGNIIAEIRTLAFEKKGSKSKRSHTFLSGKLSKPLSKGESYYFELWYSLDWFSNVASNNIGVLFYENSIPVENGESQKQPDLNSECILYSQPAEWRKLSGFFVAQSNATNFLIGNFHKNENTKYVKIENPFVYNNKEEWDILRDTTIISTYFIDDVIVQAAKYNPSNNKFGCEDNFSNLKTGQVLPLDNIYFEVSKARLLSQSTIQLDNLFLAMQRYPELEIEISGHTDNTGNAENNQILSENRAKSIYDYLLLKGIDSKRLVYIGFGMKKPIVTNDSSENKAKNRRVEIKVIKI